MTRIVALKPWHLRLLAPQPEQTILAAAQLNERFGEAVLAAGPAWACVDCEHVYAAAGLAEEAGRTVAWAILGGDLSRHMVRITRAARARLKTLGDRPVEAHIRHGHELGEKWAALLGFERDVFSFSVGPDGLRYDKWVLNVS